MTRVVHPNLFFWRRRVLHSPPGGASDVEAAATVTAMAFQSPVSGAQSVVNAIRVWV